MKMYDEQISVEAAQLQPIGGLHPVSPLPVLPADCTDDAPC